MHKQHFKASTYREEGHGAVHHSWLSVSATWPFLPCHRNVLQTSFVKMAVLHGVFYAHR